MKRLHEMPFGAHYGEEATRFRLCPPAAPPVTLELGRQSPRPVAMKSLPGGSHEARVEGATGVLRIGADGNVVRTPAWSTFSNGAVVPLTGAGG